MFLIFILFFLEFSKPGLVETKSDRKILFSHSRPPL